MSLLWFIGLTHQRRFLQRQERRIFRSIIKQAIHANMSKTSSSESRSIWPETNRRIFYAHCKLWPRTTLLNISIVSMFKGRLNTDTSPQNFWTTFLENDFNGTNKEKRSGKRNRDTFATVFFLFCSVMPVPRKLDQTILFPSLSHLWLSRRYFIGN